MKNLLLAVVLLLLFVKPAHADQLQALEKDDADRAVEVLKEQKEVLLFCGCCSNDEKIWLLMENAWSERNARGSYYEVHVKGRTIPGYMMSAVVDLAYVHINNNGMSECVGTYLSMGCDPCIESFKWDDGARKYKAEDILTTKSFYGAFDSLRAEVIAHPPLKLLNRIDMNTWLKVIRADVQLDLKAGHIVFIFSLENGYTLKQYISLTADASVTSTSNGNFSVSAGRYSPVKEEQLLDSECVYSSWNSSGISLVLDPGASQRIAIWLNTLFMNYMKVGERK
jgi:hypothetical protein